MPASPRIRAAALREAAWRSFQGTAAATVAWALAKQVGGGHDPFFAPIAAFIALNAPLGERGLNAIRLLAGVLFGIAVGEATVAALGGYGGLAVATFVAATLAALAGGSRIMVAQAATSAILVVAVADEPGVYRLADALIGAATAASRRGRNPGRDRRRPQAHRASARGRRRRAGRARPRSAARPARPPGGAAPDPRSQQPRRATLGRLAIPARAGGPRE
jgi:hypothetical protein